VTGRVNNVGDTLIVSATTAPDHDIRQTQRVLCCVTIQFFLEVRPNVGFLSVHQGKHKMAKFYIQSGSIRGIVDCYDSECAAVWAVNRVMTQMEPEQELLLEGDDESSDANLNIGMFALDDSIRISEQGFDRDDCEEIDTHLAFVQWHQLKRAIEALQKQMDDKLDDVI